MTVRENSRRSRPTMVSDTFIIVTAHNEADRIEATLRALARAFPGAPVWLADDGSRDGTSQLARVAGARVVRSERSIGKGGAATLAAREVLALLDPDATAISDEAVASTGASSVASSASSAASSLASAVRVVVLCDGDLGESAALLTPLAAEVREDRADLAVALFAKRVGGGLGLVVGFARWGIRRRCGLEPKAPISGQRALRLSALEVVLPFAEGFGMEVGMTIDAARAGQRLVEVELDLHHRATGRSLSGFAHRGGQLLDCARAYLARR
jgi:glycosyltransferase involved in cell wall biosynthesis